MTNVRATVIRIFTPDGTLVVETDDPAVKVTVEGDGDLVITGTGAQEVRLRASSYRLKATRDGQPVKLDRDLVAITRGDRQIVRVRLEGETPASVAPKAEAEAFVLLAAGQERKFATLADAVQSASAGDIVEVRGNGPFDGDPVKVTQAVTIRAGAGFRPVFNLTFVPAADKDLNHHINLDGVAPLVLEGLEFRLLVPNSRLVHQCVIQARSGLRVANCRFRTTNAHCLVGLDSPSSNWEVRNCEFLCSGEGGVIVRALTPGQNVILDNCVLTRPICVHGGGSEPQRPCLELTRTTIRSEVCAVEFVDESGMLGGMGEGNQHRHGLIIKATGNLFHGHRVLVFTQRAPRPGKILPPGDADRYLARTIDWKGERNLYSVDGDLVGHYSDEKGFSESPMPVRSLANWNRFWATAEAGSIEGRARYHGGDLAARLSSNPEKLALEDFRLRPDSVGYRAGKDGKDLGADIDLVGPGPAYERWKKTSAYQDWLKETGQVKK